MAAVVQGYGLTPKGEGRVGREEGGGRREREERASVLFHSCEH